MKPTLLVVSHVIPLRPRSGQQQRVLQMLRGARERFRVVFLTVAPAAQTAEVQHGMAALVDRCIVLPSRSTANPMARAAHALRAAVFQLRSGLKKSNYVIGQVELTPRRIRKALEGETVDLALYEYWHAWQSAAAFRARGIPVVLDMHDVLAHAYEQQLTRRKALPAALRGWMLRRYARQEHRTWAAFDGLIAINRLEMEEIRQTRDPSTCFYCPMAIDMQHWSYRHAPAQPPRLGFSGGLGSPINHHWALFALEQIMPRVWAQRPDAQLWLIGSDPAPALLRAARRNSRVVVTGYQEDLRPSLSGLTALLCPWRGQFGFRSRLVEAMALGVPVVAAPDAVAGMGLRDGEGLLLAGSPAEFATQALCLINDMDLTASHSHAARRQVEAQFSERETYDRLFAGLEKLLE